MSACLHTGLDCAMARYCALNERGLRGKAEACARYKRASRAHSEISCRTCRTGRAGMCLFVCWRKSKNTEIGAMLASLEGTSRRPAQAKAKYTAV